MAQKVIELHEPKKLIDKLIYVVALTYPLSTIPQIVDIYASKSSENISLLTWLLYDAFTFVFLWYAIQNRLKPLIIEYSMWIVAQSIVVAGILIYR
jgi:uncharacterized protein with PQ loop repeat